MQHTNTPKDSDHDEVIFAGFWPRLMAHNIDLIILLPVFYLLSVFIKENSALYLVCGFLTLLYEVGFISSSWAATPGKRIMKIRVTNARIGVIGWPRSLARSLIKVLSIATLFIGYAVIAFHPKKKGLHDLIVHSSVIFEHNT